MALMKWTDRYSVGIGKMDEQHKIIFDIINELFESLKGGIGSDVLGLINRLSQYTQQHFKEEERVLESLSHPDLEWQKEEHLKFYKTVEAFKKKAARESFSSINVELSHFLMMWWNNHILEGDKKYAIAD